MACCKICSERRLFEYPVKLRCYCLSQPSRGPRTGHTLSDVCSADEELEPFLQWVVYDAKPTLWQRIVLQQNCLTQFGGVRLVEAVAEKTLNYMPKMTPTTDEYTS